MYEGGKVIARWSSKEQRYVTHPKKPRNTQGLEGGTEGRVERGMTEKSEPRGFQRLLSKE